MKSALLAFVFLTVSLPLPAQVSAPAAAKPSPAVQDLYTALIGEWTGVLEYRDYKSDKRVKLPTWCSISANKDDSLRFRYIYDDGPNKTVTEAILVTIDPVKQTYTIVDPAGKDAPSVSTIAGMENLRQGRGTLVLSGTGTDNGKPAEVRTTVSIGRNLLEILRETKVAGEDFKFRHAYTFTRSIPPTLFGGSHQIAP